MKDVFMECSAEERKLLQSLSTPARIQDYLDALPINHEKRGETCYSPRQVFMKQKAHCLEGAFLAAAALWFHGEKPLVMNFRTTRNDEDHAVTLFNVDGYWGALSKTNHAILRYRDPIYQTVRELAFSYFHEYFMFEDGKKTLRGYTKPIDMHSFGNAWLTAEENLWPIADTLATAPHLPFVPATIVKKLRPVTPFEVKTLRPVEWPKSDPRT